MARHHNTHGSKLGPRIAGIVTDAMADHLRRSGPHRVKLGMQLQHEFFELVGSEIRRTVAPHAFALADSDSTPKWLSETLRFMGKGNGQLATMLTTTAYGTAVGASLTGAIQPVLTQIQQDAFRDSPVKAIAADGAASLYARGLMDGPTAYEQAAKNGYSVKAMEYIVAGSVSRPDVGSVIELLNRGQIGEDDAHNRLRLLGYTDNTSSLMLALRVQLLSPQELADLVTFGVLDHAEARGKAAHSGMSAEDFDRLVEGNGQPPALGDLLEAYRRGIIDTDRLHRGLVQGPTRIEWFDVLRALRYSPLSPSDAVAGVVQGHISDAEGERLAEQAGVNPDNWRLLVENHGRPPGVQQLIALYQRGSVTRGDVERAIRQSDIKDEWIPAIMQFARRLPEQGMVTTAVRHGALPHDQAIRHLLELGYDASVAGWLVQAASKQQTQHERDLTKGEIIALHQAGGIDTTEAGRHLQALGYSPGESSQLLSLSDLRRARARRDSAVHVVQSRYVAHHIDENAASGALDSLGVGHTERDELIHTWELERSLNARGLTEAQVGRLFKLEHITEQDAIARWQTMGLSAADAQLLALLY